MTDEDKPGFHVVDRRSGATDSSDPEAGASPEPATEAPRPTPIETTETASDAPTAEDTGAESPDAETFESEDRETGLPDPALLLSMGSMQMDTRSLMLSLVGIFDGHAWRAMGFLADPRTGEAHQDLPSAQLAIDTVQFLLSKLDAQMTEIQRRETQRRLSDLRMNYIAKLKENATRSE